MVLLIYPIIRCSSQFSISGLVPRKSPSSPRAGPKSATVSTSSQRLLIHLSSITNASKIDSIRIALLKVPFWGGFRGSLSFPGSSPPFCGLSGLLLGLSGPNLFLNVATTYSPFLSSLSLLSWLLALVLNENDLKIHSQRPYTAEISFNCVCSSFPDIRTMETSNKLPNLLSSLASWVVINIWHFLTPYLPTTPKASSTLSTIRYKILHLTMTSNCNALFKYLSSYFIAEAGASLSTPGLITREPHSRGFRNAPTDADSRAGFGTLECRGRWIDG